MASNQTNRFQSLDSLVEEFIDEGETRQMDEFIWLLKRWTSFSASSLQRFAKNKATGNTSLIP